jgi:hypothetical protein
MVGDKVLPAPFRLSKRRGSGFARESFSQVARCLAQACQHFCPELGSVAPGLSPSKCTHGVSP